MDELAGQVVERVAGLREVVDQWPRPIREGDVGFAPCEGIADRPVMTAMDRRRPRDVRDDVVEPVGNAERLRPACRIDLALQVLPRRPSLDGPPSVSSRWGPDDAQVIDRRKLVQDACQPVELARVENGLRTTPPPTNAMPCPPSSDFSVSTPHALRTAAGGGKGTAGGFIGADHHAAPSRA